MQTLFSEYGAILAEGLLATLYMTLAATVLSYGVGLPLGMLLWASSPAGVLRKPSLYKILSALVNTLRSVPFIILIVALTPMARALVGKSIGPTAAIVSLVVAAAPFVARVVEQSLLEVEPGAVEAAFCMGATRRQILCQVVLREAVPGLLRGVSISAIALIGYSAIAGAVGAGGLGDIAIRYGYYRGATGVMWLTLAILIAIVAALQGILSLLARRIDRRDPAGQKAKKPMFPPSPLPFAPFQKTASTPSFAPQKKANEITYTK